MNTINNKRKKESQERIKKVFIELIQNKEISEITVSDICKIANLNRSTFYSNYIDIYDLADKIKDDLFNDVLTLYPDETKDKKHSYDFLKLFKHIKENQLFYKLYFKLGFDFKKIFIEKGAVNIANSLSINIKHVDYHVEFFSAGITAIIKKWLANDCKESPETISKILLEEYSRELSIFQ